MIAEPIFKRDNTGIAGLIIQICRLSLSAATAIQHDAQKCRWIASE
jgi:hypothetical protein